VEDTTPFYKKLCYHLISLSLIGYFLFISQEILIPLVLAILLASLLLPLNKRLEKKKLPRVAAISISLILSAVVIGLIIYFITYQISGFLDDLPTIRERLGNLSLTIQKWVRETFGVTIRKQNQYLNETAAQMKQSSAGFLGQTFGTLTEVLSYLVLLPLYSFLILYHRGMIKKFIIDVFKGTSDRPITEILNASQSVSLNFITGLLIEMSVVFTLNAVGFLILGIKYPVFLALVAALLNLIPYIGMLVANIFCMLITLISGDTMHLGDVVWVGVILGIVQLIDNDFLMSMIVAAKLRINALATLTGVLVGGALWGIPGMFLSIPGLAVIKVICDRVDGFQPFGMLLGVDPSIIKTAKNSLVQPAEEEVSD
jgi:predicted PurR-regulated permease PerM